VVLDVVGGTSGSSVVMAGSCIPASWTWNRDTVNNRSIKKIHRLGYLEDDGPPGLTSGLDWVVRY
jgi:hypothetical protein